MKSRDFCYWLQGFFEVRRADKNVSQSISLEQVGCIETHLKMVFKHEIDPSHGDQAHQDELSQIHNPGPGMVSPNSQIIKC